MVSTTVAAKANISQARTDKLIDWLREYAKERINSQMIDERRCVPPYIILDLGNRGILGMQIPEQYGGLALKYRDFMRVLEQMAAIDLTLATFVSLNNTLGVRPIMGYATQSVRDELLPILARGREVSSFGMTEPGAGADIGRISTLAVANGRGGWLLQGMKRWNGFAGAGIMNVFARVVGEADPTQSGLTGFVVRQGAPGLHIGSESLTMGLRGIIQNSLYFDNVPVGARDLLGELGNGMVPADDAVMFARLGVGAISIGGMKRCTQLMLRYAMRRSTATGRLLDSPITLARLSNLAAAIATLEELLKAIAEMLDGGQKIPREIAVVVKIAGSEYLWQAADDLMQILGGRGYMENNIAPQILRDARVLRIGEGPNESLKIFLGKSVVHTESLHQFLRDRLQVPHISDKLKEVAEKINSRYLGANGLFANKTSAMAWAYSLIGEVVIHAILLVVVEQAAKLNPAEQLQQAVTWAKLHFDQSLEKALSGEPSESFLLGADAIVNCVSSYTKSIDDIEQNLAGEDHELDELLRRNLAQKAAPQQAIALEIPTQPVAPKPAPAPKRTPIQTSESIQDWIIDWLVRKLKLSAHAIEPHQAFADCGMDSMLAVELAQDLSDWLNLSLEATILWNFPTIAALAQRLATEVSHDTPTLQNKRESDFILNEDLEAISESEIAKLLAEEIEKSAQRE